MNRTAKWIGKGAFVLLAVLVLPGALIGAPILALMHHLEHRHGPGRLEDGPDAAGR